MTILGTRPEIIRLSQVIPILDEHSDHFLVHTGQNFTPELSDNFFSELRVRPPNVNLGIRAGSFGEQAARILESIERLLIEQKPDRVLILGDTNSGLSAIIADRLGVPVYHMEAGNRCYDDRVPEEVNRRIIDGCSAVLLPYTARSKDNLIREGFEPRRIHVVGNPIFEVIQAFRPAIDASDILRRLRVERGKYFLVTAHRSENVDDPDRFSALLASLQRLHEDYGFPVIYSFHPRSKSRAEAHAIDLGVTGVRFETPFAFADFVRLEQDAYCVLSDSGTVQEETCILGVPSVTVRDVTERPETLDCGSTILSGVEPDSIGDAVKLVLRTGADWTPPTEYTATNVAQAVCRLVLGYRMPTEAESRWQRLTGIRKGERNVEDAALAS